jgi:hypothetical protein
MKKLYVKKKGGKYVGKHPKGQKEGIAERKQQVRACRSHSGARFTRCHRGLISSLEVSLTDGISITRSR